MITFMPPISHHTVVTIRNTSIYLPHFVSFHVWFSSFLVHILVVVVNSWIKYFGFGFMSSILIPKSKLFIHSWMTLPSALLGFLSPSTWAWWRYVMCIHSKNKLFHFWCLEERERRRDFTFHGVVALLLIPHEMEVVPRTYCCGIASHRVIVHYACSLHYII